MNRKNFILLLICLLMPLCLMAEDISEEQARQMAAQFFTDGTHGAVRRAPSTMRLAYATEASELYVYNQPGGGWVVVAGNDGTLSTVLAFSDTGSFDYEKAPEMAKRILKGYAEGIRELRQTGRRAAASAAVLRRAGATESLEPLLKTTWNQTTPYNNLCPEATNGGMEGYGGRCPSGCVPVAVAQVMNYWQWPRHGYGTHTSTKSSQTVDFNQSVYDWDNMLDDYSNGYNEAQAQAVAKLMADIGCAMNTIYGNGESGTYVGDMQHQLFRYFDYSPDVTTEWWTDAGSGGVSYSDWLKNELRAKRPVICSGNVRGYEDHEVVCDGFQYYEEGMNRGGGTRFNFFHINFGWGGQSDGYFAEFDEEMYFATLNHWYANYIGFRPNTLPRVLKDNNYYLIRDKEAQLAGLHEEGTLDNPKKVVVHDQIEYEGKTYPVTSIYPELFHTIPVSEITFSKHMKSIPSRLFSNFQYIDDCPLRSINLPEGVEEIADSAFLDLRNLSSYTTFPTTLRRIGKSAFQGTNLGFVDFKGTGFVIDDYGLATRTKIMAEGLEKAAKIGEHGIGLLIGDFIISPTCQYAESAVSGEFDNIILPKDLKKFNHDMFSYRTSAAAYIVKNGNPNYVSNRGMLLSKDMKTLVAFPCLEISDGQTIRRDLAYVPTGITKIDKGAFSYGPGIVTIPATVKQMDGAFTYCSLRYLTMLSSTPPVISDKKTFGTYTPTDCKLQVPHGCKAAYEQANVWKDFGRISEDELYQQGQFYYTLFNEYASVAARNTEAAFDGHAKIPSTVTINGKTHTVTGIENGAFNGDSQLLTVTLPKTLRAASDFDGCDQLYEINVEAGNSTLHSTDGMLFSNIFDDNTLVFCPPMQKQGNSITPRTKVTLPTETQVIGDDAHTFTESLLAVVIPATVKRIGREAFKNCTNLTTIICLGSPPPSYTESDHTFPLNVKNNATFYVPKGSIAAYGNTWAYWEILDNAHVVEFDPATFNPNSVEVKEPEDPKDAPDPEFYEPSDNPDTPNEPAIDGTVTSLIILFKDKTTQTFELADLPVITIAGSDLKVAARNADVTIPLSDIVRYTFQKHSITGITETELDSETADYRDGVLTLSGLKAGSTVSLYTLDGRLIQSTTVTHDGTFRHSLATLPQGVYIVKVNTLSYKIMKR